jgi:hypothetical protein
MATKKQAKGKMTEAEINKHIKKVKEESEKHRKTIKKGDNFVALDDEELRKKLQRVNSPFINSMGWGGGGVPPGGTINISIGFFNPDPVAQNGLYVHLFVGSGAPVSDNALYLLNVNDRFPRLTEPTFFGTNLAPGTGTTLNYSLKVPSNMEPSNYMCNAALLQLRSFDIGTVIDRSLLVFRVT